MQRGDRRRERAGPAVPRAVRSRAPGRDDAAGSPGRRIERWNADRIEIAVEQRRWEAVGRARCAVIRGLLPRLRLAFGGERPRLGAPDAQAAHEVVALA